MAEQIAILVFGSLASAGLISAFIWSRVQAFDRRFGSEPATIENPLTASTEADALRRVINDATSEIARATARVAGIGEHLATRAVPTSLGSSGGIADFSPLATTPRYTLRFADLGGSEPPTYVTDTPLHDRVTAERRTVDQPLSVADADAFRERTIDMTATGEEAVVGKTARVIEEVVVSKTFEEHVEDVANTARRTEVEVDRNADVEQSGADTRWNYRRF